MHIDQFRCKNCGNCCRWTGCVKLLDREAEAIAEYLGLKELEFIERYTGLSPDRRQLSLTENEQGHCIFLDSSSGCRIHAVKPRQCRDFPSRWNFSGWELECAGGQALLAAERRAEARHA